MLGEDALAANLAGIRRQLCAFLDLDDTEGGATGFLVDNHTWLSGI